jgi:signal transduction histidine kinase
MRHRASSFGGTYEIESATQGGTRARVRLPLAAIVQHSAPPAIEPAASIR